MAGISAAIHLTKYLVSDQDSQPILTIENKSLKERWKGICKIMETNKTPKMPFGKKIFGMPAGGSFCCGSFMADQEQFESCCGFAEEMGEAGCDCSSSSEQNERGSETTKESEDS